MFKSQNLNYGESHYCFSPISRDSFSLCSKCKTFPYCVILHNSGFRYKHCPCHSCFVSTMCVRQCDIFRKEVESIFHMKVSTDYKYHWYMILESQQ